MTELFYAVVKASLHASDASVFGLKSEEVQALLSRYPGSSKNVINGILVKGNPLEVINSLGELGYRVICSSGESDIVWTLKREGLVDPDYYPGKETQVAKQIINKKSTSRSPGSKYSKSPDAGQSTPPKTDMGSLQKKKQKLNVEETSGTSQQVVTLENEDTSQQLILEEEKKKKVEEEKKKKVEEEKNKKDYKMGAKPEDFQEFLPDTSRIYIRNPESFDQGASTEGIHVILRTNECSPNNPLARPIPTQPSMAGLGTLYPQPSGFGAFPNAVGTAQSTTSCCPCPPTSVKPKTPIKSERKPIWYYAMMSEISEVKELLGKGCNVNEPDPSGYTALHYAAKNGNADICRLLLNRGAAVNLQTQAGQATPLHRAAGAGKIEVCKLLLNCGAQVLLRDIDGRTPLHRAVEGGHEAATTFLLECGLEALQIRDNRGYTPYDLAKDESLKALITRTVLPTRPLNKK